MSIQKTLAKLVSFIQSGVGAVVRSLEDVLRERGVSAKDYGLSTANSRAANDAALYNALNSGANTVFIPSSYPDKYLLSEKIQITAALRGITLKGEDKQNTILSWQIDTTTTNKFAFLLDSFVKIKNLTIENTGNATTGTGALVSYVPTVGNGMRNCEFKNIRLKGWYSGICASADGATLTMALSQAFSNIFENIEFDSCWSPIRLGVGANNNVWIRPAFWNTKGTREIYLNEGSSNLFLSAQFEPVDPSVTSGFLQAELVLSPNNIFLNPYFEPCYGIVADSSPGTVIESPMIEGFDFTIGTLSSSAILRSTNATNAAIGGYYDYPLISKVTTPVCRASSNPTSYAVADDNINTLTLCDGIVSRDSNFKMRAAGLHDGAIALTYKGTWQPSIIGTGGTSAHTYTQRLGWYIRVGNLCTVFFRAALSAVDAGMTGNARISGLPFPAISDTLYIGAISIAEYRVDLSAGYSALFGEVTASASYVDLVQNGDNIAPAYLPSANILNNTIIAGSFSYMCNPLF